MLLVWLTIVADTHTGRIYTASHTSRLDCYVETNIMDENRGRSLKKI
jgi:hypothetical protein